MIKRLFAVVALLCATTVHSTAQNYIPDWYRKKANHFEAVDKNFESNFTMAVTVTIDEVQCDSAFEIGVFCGEECRLSSPLYSSKDFYDKFYFYSTLTIKGEENETVTFRLYDHRNKTEVVTAVSPQMEFISDKQYGSLNSQPYNLAFGNSSTHRTALLLDDNTDLPFSGRLHSTTAEGIACSYTRNAYLDGGFETIVLPYDTDITEIKAQGFVFEKFSGFGDNCIVFAELADDENLKAGVPYIFRYTGTASDGRMEIEFTANVQQASSEIIASEGWTGTFEAMDGNGIAGKYILNITGDKMQKAGNKAWLSPYRCYLELPAGVEASMLSVVHDGNTTGIGNIGAHSDSEAIFDIYGRRLKELPKSGIVIKNNRKIYIK
ncbi:MAG: hypothetical protein IKV23_04530 [Bacteroidaceae bacterium]|nr:hypothetical protein [Bacteroidaceae bacterium]